MAANRSLTAGWRQSLTQLKDRQAPIEIAVWRGETFDGEDVANTHLMWRVRLLDITDQGIIVEQPSTLGQAIPLQDGVRLVALYAVGQNRWQFFSRVLSTQKFALNKHRTVDAIRIDLPSSVERCRRRRFVRLETAAKGIPPVEVWPLLDPKSVVVAERANELEFMRAAHGDESLLVKSERETLDEIDDMRQPEVGPQFVGRLDNIGGGGVGLRFEPDQTSQLNSNKLFWMRLSLPPEMPRRLCVTCKLTHTHIESMQTTYAGMAFDFSFNPQHQRFVTDQICSYVARQQCQQLKRQRA